MGREPFFGKGCHVCRMSKVSAPEKPGMFCESLALPGFAVLCETGRRVCSHVVLMALELARISNAEIFTQFHTTVGHKKNEDLL